MAEEFKAQKDVAFEDQLELALKNQGATKFDPLSPKSIDQPPVPAPEPAPEPVPEPELDKPKRGRPPKDKEGPEPAPKPAPEPEPKEGAQPKGFDVAEFNKLFGTAYEDENVLKSSLKELSDIKSKYEQLTSDHEKTKTVLEEAKASLDPRKYFVNEDEYKRQLILKKYGTEVNPSLLNKIVSSDLNAISDIDVLVLGKMISNPNIRGGEQGAREMVYKQLDIDEDDDPKDWTTLTHNLVSEAALNTRKKLNELKAIEVPQQVDFDAQRQQAAQQVEAKKQQLSDVWGKITGKMMEDFDEFSLYRTGEDGSRQAYFSYKVDDDFRRAASEMVGSYLIDNLMEPNEENVREARSYMQDLFLRKHVNDMFQAYGRDVESRVREEMEKKYENPAPPNRQEAPQDGDNAAEEKLLAYARGEKWTPGTKVF